MTDETVDFPILCDSCLGEDPYVRMTKRPFGKSCKICERPFTNFSWQPGKDLRFKQTEICQTCAKIKNCCQTCTLDLEFNLPIRVRDTALQIKEDIARHDRNREYYIRNVEKEMEKTGKIISPAQAGKAELAGRELIKKYIRSEPYYKQQLAEATTKGDAKNVVSDPLAKLLASRTDEKNLLTPPEDLSIMALFMTGIDESISEQDLRDFFGRFGEITSVAVIHRSRCAFVNFASRNAAEKAAEFAHYESTVNNKKLKVQWARPKAGTPSGPRAKKSVESTGPLLGDKPRSSSVMPPPPGSSSVRYASQNPTQLGSVREVDRR